MEQRALGRSGLQVSSLGLGCNNFGWLIEESASKEVIARALDLGINFLDTADVYGESEIVLGKALLGRRHQVVLATKFGSAARGRPGGAARNYILESVQRSLQRLQTDYLDVLYLHRPDATVPLSETLETLDGLIREGKVRHAACSNMTPQLLEESAAYAASHHSEGFVVTQEHYNLLVRGLEQQLLPVAERYNIGIVPYFPLASGLLTGKYQRGVMPAAGTRVSTWKHLASSLLTSENFDRIERLQTFAAAHGRTIGELAIAWLLSKPYVGSVIAGATRASQLEENCRAASWKLTPTDLMEIDRIVPPLLS
jgi:aryl-alcohol dehydrogenase-like predicted oxidoreductase